MEISCPHDLTGFDISLLSIHHTSKELVTVKFLYSMPPSKGKRLIQSTYPLCLSSTVNFIATYLYVLAIQYKFRTQQYTNGILRESYRHQ